MHELDSEFRFRKWPILRWWHESDAGRGEQVCGA